MVYFNNVCKCTLLGRKNIAMDYELWSESLENLRALAIRVFIYKG
jgi:hypothetical protein